MKHPGKTYLENENKQLKAMVQASEQILTEYQWEVMKLQKKIETRNWIIMSLVCIISGLIIGVILF